MKAVWLGMAGFLFAAAVAYSGLTLVNQVKKERVKEAILIDLACLQPATHAKFGLQCPPANVSPPPTQ